MPWNDVDGLPFIILANGVFGSDKRRVGGLSDFASGRGSMTLLLERRQLLWRRQQSSSRMEAQEWRLPGYWNSSSVDESTMKTTWIDWSRHVNIFLHATTSPFTFPLAASQSPTSSPPMWLEPLTLVTWRLPFTDIKRRKERRKRGSAVERGLARVSHKGEGKQPRFSFSFSRTKKGRLGAFFFFCKGGSTVK